MSGIVVHPYILFIVFGDRTVFDIQVGIAGKFSGRDIQQITAVGGKQYPFVCQEEVARDTTVVVKACGKWTYFFQFVGRVGVAVDFILVSNDAGILVISDDMFPTLALRVQIVCLPVPVFQ